MEPTYDDNEQAEQQRDSEQTLKPFAALALPSPSGLDSELIENNDRRAYPYSIEKAEAYLLNAGYVVAHRTLSNYCQTNQFQCKKFSSDGVRRWFIKESSVATHLKKLKRDHSPNANDRKPSHAKSATGNISANSMSEASKDAIASDSNEYAATAIFNVKYVKFLEEQVSLKDSQLKSLQAQTDQVTKLTNGLGMLLLNKKEQPSDDSGGNYQT